MTESISELKIESINARSIGSQVKRDRFFNYLKKRNTDIFGIADKRIDPKIEQKVKEDWGGPSFFSSFSSQARGVEILTKKKFANQDTEHEER